VLFSRRAWCLKSIHARASRRFASIARSSVIGSMYDRILVHLVKRSAERERMEAAVKKVSAFKFLRSAVCNKVVFHVEVYCTRSTIRRATLTPRFPRLLRWVKPRCFQLLLWQHAVIWDIFNRHTAGFSYLIKRYRITLDYFNRSGLFNQSVVAGR